MTTATARILPSQEEHPTHPRFSVYVAADRYDPSRTMTLRNAFARAVVRRFRRLRGVIYRAVWTEDCFGLRGGETHVTALQLRTPGRRAFAFPRNSRKVAGFMEWLNHQIQAGILEVREFAQVGEGIEQAWTNRYIYDSYKRGVARARHQMRQAGFDVPPLDATGGIDASMATPFHVDRVGLLFTRAFNELKGITDAMDQQISRVLAEGIAQGVHPRTLARQLNAAISGQRLGELGITDTLGRFIPAERRAQMLARTEVIRAHAEAQLQEFRNWRVEQVYVVAEWQTAGYNVCPECSAREYEKFTIEAATGEIPLHPNCRCIWVPVEKNAMEAMPPTPEPEDPVAANFKLDSHKQKYLAAKEIYRRDLEDMLQKNPGIREAIEKWTKEMNPFPDEIWSYMHGNAKLKKGMKAFDKWQMTTKGDEPMSFKYRARQLEKGMPKMIYAEDMTADKIVRYERELESLLSDIDYIHVRAFSQAYMEVLEFPDEILLYRGTDGGVGRRIAKALSSNLKLKNCVITDAPLAGYTEAESVAFKFGLEEGGVTVRLRVNRADVFLPRDLISEVNNRYWIEKEWVIRGLDKYSFDMKDISFNVDVPDSVGGFQTQTKKFGETLEEFAKRVKWGQ